MVVYYTGTGNSRYAAEFLADKLGDEVIDSFSFIRNGIAGEFISGKPYVFVCPIYGWRIPRIFEQFIRSAEFSGSGEAYFVITCGESIGAASARLGDLCRGKGLEFMGAAPVVMPENYIALFDSPEEALEERLMAVADKTLARAAKRILAGDKLPGKPHSIKDKLKSGVVNELFYKFCIKSKPFYAADTCTGCGLCEVKCPLGSISIKDERPIWSDACTHCMACISHCPAEAIEYGKASLGKRRYRCRDYKKA